MIDLPPFPAAWRAADLPRHPKTGGPLYSLVALPADAPLADIAREAGADPKASVPGNHHPDKAVLYESGVLYVAGDCQEALERAVESWQTSIKE